MDRLIVKNFGPLKDVDIELNKINLFIGENGSGKSVLAKIVTIVMNTLNLSNEQEILKKFDNFNINYILDETIVKYTKNNEFYKSNQKSLFGDNISPSFIEDFQGMN